jgi:PBSX family phage terminase large subunit
VPINWAPFSPKALQSIRESDARINIWEGAVRSSKTIASLVRWIAAVEASPPSDPLIMVGKTERSLRRNILDPLADMVGPKRFHLNQGLAEARLCGHKMHIAGANDERAEQKIRGGTYGKAYCDEMSLYPESFLRMLLSRLSLPNAQLFGTTNPDSPYHYLKTQFLDRAGELNLKSWHFRIDDNLSLSEDYKRALAVEYTGLWYKRFYEGLWVAGEGAVYPMLDLEKHVIDYEPELIPGQLFVGCDYGTTNPTVFLLAGMDTEGRLVVFDEWRYSSVENYAQTMTDEQYCRDLIKFFLNRTPAYVIIDPSAASFIAACVDSHQVPGVTLADNAVLDGIRNVSTLLGANRLLIHKRCQGLLREMMGYVWDPKAQLRGEDSPVKRDDHGADALRYIVRSTQIYWNQKKYWNNNDQMAAA